MSDTMLERVARALATKHYADRFAKAADDPHVQMNAGANWHIFGDDARAAIEAIGEYVVAFVEDHQLCELTKAGNRDPFIAFSIGAKAQRSATAKALSAALSEAQSTGEKK